MLSFIHVPHQRNSFDFDFSLQSRFRNQNGFTFKIEKMLIQSTIIGNAEQFHTILTFRLSDIHNTHIDLYGVSFE